MTSLFTGAAPAVLLGADQFQRAVWIDPAENMVAGALDAKRLRARIVLRSLLRPQRLVVSHLLSPVTRNDLPALRTDADLLCARHVLGGNDGQQFGNRITRRQDERTRLVGVAIGEIDELVLHR
jgi:hypothetical protein